MANTAKITAYDAVHAGLQVREVTFEFTAVGGVASITTDFEVCGRIQRVVTKPLSTNKPTDDYDITLKEEKVGIDLLDGQGADRDDANAEQIFVRFSVEDQIGGGNTYGVCLHPMVNDKLVLGVSNAGTGQATVYVYIVP